MKEFKPEDVLANRYKLRKILNDGRNSVVWTAADMMLADRLVVLKIFRAQDTQAKNEIIQNFWRLDALLPHYHILKPFDLGVCEEHSVLYAKLKFVRDGNLDDRLSGNNTLSQSEIAQFIVQVGGAIQHLHNAGIIHCDIKPGNILVQASKGEFHYYLADFDFSGFIDTSQGGRVTQLKDEKKEKRPFSMAYLSPDGEEDTTRDIFAFGVSIYELLTGKLPLGDKGGQILIRAPKEINLPDGFPRELSEMVKKCIERTPSLRPDAELLVLMANEYLKKQTWPKMQEITDEWPDLLLTAKSKFMAPKMFMLYGFIFSLGALIGGFGFKQYSVNDNNETIPIANTDSISSVNSGRNEIREETVAVVPKISERLPDVTGESDWGGKEKKINLLLAKGMKILDDGGDQSQAITIFIKARRLNSGDRQFAKGRIDSLYQRYSAMGGRRFEVSEYKYARDWFKVAQALMDSPEIRQKIADCDEKIGN